MTMGVIAAMAESEKIIMMKSVPTGVRQIAHAHQGTVDVTSSAEQGTTFTATFPRGITVEQTAAGAVAVAERSWDQLEILAIAGLPDAAYDDIARLAADACDTPFALVTLINRNQHWIKGRVGVKAESALRVLSLCEYLASNPSHPMVIEDVVAESRSATGSGLQVQPEFRFFAGVALVTSRGEVWGTVCVVDAQPRSVRPDQVDILKGLASQLVELLEQQVATKALR